MQREVVGCKLEIVMQAFISTRVLSFTFGN